GYAFDPHVCPVLRFPLRPAGEWPRFGGGWKAIAESIFAPAIARGEGPNEFAAIVTTCRPAVRRSTPAAARSAGREATRLRRFLRRRRTSAMQRLFGRR